MERKIVPFTTEEAWLELRAKDITSTEASALFGKSPYSTAFELYHNKRDQTVVRIADNERMKWGRALQDAIAKEGVLPILVNNFGEGVTIRKMDEYVRIPELRLGSSFDFEVVLPNGRKGPLEIKNVDGIVFAKDWNKKGAVITEAPIHIEAQLQHQMLVGGYEIGFLGALVGGNRLYVLERQAVASIHEAIQERAAQLWADIAAENVPSPDWVEDAEFILKLFQRTTPGKEYDASMDAELRELAFRLNGEVAIASEAERQKAGIKAQIVSRIQDAVRAQGPDYHITATPTKTGRDVRVYIKEQAA